MSTNKILKFLLIIALVAAISLSMVGRAEEKSGLHGTLNAVLVIGGFVCGILTFHTKYSKEFLLPCFMILYIHHTSGTILNKISFQELALGESFTGLCNFLIAFVMVVCFKEIFHALRD